MCSLFGLPVVFEVKAPCVNEYMSSQGGTMDLHAFLSAYVFVVSINMGYIFTYLGVQWSINLCACDGPRGNICSCCRMHVKKSCAPFQAELFRQSDSM